MGRGEGKGSGEGGREAKKGEREGGRVMEREQVMRYHAGFAFKIHF